MSIKDRLKNLGNSIKGMFQSEKKSYYIPNPTLTPEDMAMEKQFVDDTMEDISQLIAQGKQDEREAKKILKNINKTTKEIEKSTRPEKLEKRINKGKLEDGKKMTKKERKEYKQDEKQLSAAQLLEKWEEKLSPDSIEYLAEVIDLEAGTTVYTDQINAQKLHQSARAYGLTHEDEEFINNPEHYTEKEDPMLQALKTAKIDKMMKNMGIDPKEIEAEYEALQNELNEKNEKVELDYNKMLNDDKKDTAMQKNSSPEERLPSVPKTDLSPKIEQPKIEKPQKTREFAK